MVSVYMQVKTSISRYLCANQYAILTVGLEDTSKLRAHSTSLINIATIKGKQLRTCTCQCFKEAKLVTLTKLKKNISYSYVRNKEKGNNLQTRCSTAPKAQWRIWAPLLIRVYIQGHAFRPSQDTSLWLGLS